VQSFWNCPLGVADHLLLALVAVGEEIFYRLIWIAVMLSFGLSMPLALVISSVAYGFNHLSFGGLSVFSKSVTGLCYGALYLLGGQSIILPVVTHVLQNFTLLRLTRERHA
jgi:membrane protease YdiL (CAAX protease family)